MDLGSTKTEVVSAMSRLPDRFDPVGGHPMCGKERSSLLEADAQLYREAAFALVSLPSTSDRARSLAEQVVLAVGAYPVWLNPAEHDLWTAFTSHLPYLVSNTLAAIAPHEAASLVGPGFRSTSRLAVTSPRMMLDTLFTNRENILKSIGDFRSHLDNIENLLERGEDEALLALLAQGAQRREELSGDAKQGGNA
jgi:prephenate dehydrogenase